MTPDERREAERARKRRWYWDHREEQLKKKRQYDTDHREAERARKLRWYREHREERIEYARMYHTEHREADLERNRRYYAEHRETELEKRRRYNAKHRKAMLAYMRLYNARRRDAKIAYMRRYDAVRADRFAAGLAETIAGIRGHGITGRQMIADELNRRQVVTLRGNKWTANGVSKLLKTLARLRRLADPERAVRRARERR
jgi:hypothetical protein